MNKIDPEKTVTQQGYDNLSFLSTKPIKIHTKDYGILCPDFVDWYQPACSNGKKYGYWIIQFKPKPLLVCRSATNRNRLKVGDIIVVSTEMLGKSEYPVKKIEGNKAITDFRIFNTKIYMGGQVYEFGNRNTTNGYWLKKSL